MYPSRREWSFRTDILADTCIAWVQIYVCLCCISSSVPPWFFFFFQLTLGARGFVVTVLSSKVKWFSFLILITSVWKNVHLLHTLVSLPTPLQFLFKINLWFEFWCITKWEIWSLFVWVLKDSNVFYPDFS